MRLVHEHHQVVELRKILEVAFADVFAQSFDPRRLAAANLGVNLRDIEDIDVGSYLIGVEAKPSLLLRQLVTHAHPGLVVIPCDENGRIGGKLADAAKDVLGRIRCEVGNQLVVNRQVRGEHEEMPDTLGQVEVADEGSHQPGFAHASGQRETERWEVSLEVRNGFVFRLDCLQGLGNIGVGIRPDEFTNAVQYLQRIPLRLT